MKKILSLFAFTLLFTSMKAQSSLDVTQWEFSTQTENNVQMVEFKVKLDEGWHLYSQYMEGDGPVPTSFTFEKNDKIDLEGKVMEEKSITVYDPNFDMNVSYFKDQTTFKQKIKKNGKDKTKLSGAIEFMVCNDSMCYPPDILEFTIELP